MKTAVVISTRGFGVFLHELLVDPEGVRFVGIFTEADIRNLTEDQRRYFDQIHVVPCAIANPSPMLSSLVDFEAARRVVAAALASTTPHDLSIHCYDEQNILLAAELRSLFGTTGAQLTEILPFRDKLMMKRKLVARNLRVPKYGRFRPELFLKNSSAYFQQIVAEIGLPFILKPTDSAGAEGVLKICSRGDFTALPADLGRTYEYEEFISGTMYSVNILSKNRKTLFGGVTEYMVNSLQVQEGRVNADINLIDSDPRVPRMVRFAESALDALGWPDGASHLELFLTPEDELVFLEVGARFKGMAGLAAMQRNYGVAFLNEALQIEAGLRSRPYDGEQVYCFDGVIPKRAGVVQRLLEPDIESDFEITWRVAPGDRIEQSNSLLANAGTFLVWNSDYDVLYRDFRRLAGYVPILYRDSHPARTGDVVAVGTPSQGGHPGG